MRLILNQECYLNDKQYLYGYNGDKTELKVGNHEFPFSFTLPKDIPSTFEGSHGNVRYYAEAVIDLEWRFDHNVMCPFTVVAQVDLNLDPEAKVLL